MLKSSINLACLQLTQINTKSQRKVLSLCHASVAAKGLVWDITVEQTEHVEATQHFNQTAFHRRTRAAARCFSASLVSAMC